MLETNPTSLIDVSFHNYLTERTSILNSHLIGGIPDYAYGPDFTLRQKINAIPGAVKLVQAATQYVIASKKTNLAITGLKVGPTQFPEIYEMGKRCAKILGIGIPTIYIEPNIGELNAYTLSLDDEEPIIVLYSAIVERFTPDELLTVIGHECGHIHNKHGVYNMIAQLLIDGGTSVGVNTGWISSNMAELISIPISTAFTMWSRAAEVTCDRAGVICSNNLEDSLSAEAKFLTAGNLKYGQINIDEVLKQYDEFKDSPFRLQEMLYDHPVTVRRIFADKEFFNSEVLYSWRPEWKKLGMTLLDKQELDARCEKYIAVMKRG